MDEALVATASQNDTLFTWSTSVADSAKISLGVDCEITTSDYETDAPCKVLVTNTLSSRSFAFTMTKSGTIAPVVTRERTGETVSVEPIEFVPSTPNTIYNLTSADKTRNDVVNTTVAAVNEETNRLACGDKFNYGEDVPVGSISFKVYKGNSTRKKTLQNPEKTLLCECVSDGTTLDVSKSNGIVTVGDDYISIAKEDSDTFYAIEFTAEGSAYWFVDNPTTKFGNTGESTKSYNVYRFEDSYTNTFASGTTQSTGEYKGAWCDSGKEVVLSHQYTTSFSNSKATNVVMNLASKTVENNHETDSYKSNYKKNNTDASLTIKTNKGSIVGTDTSVTVSHDQFYGRIKTVEWKTFNKLDNSITLTELHEGTVELGEAAGLDCILLSKLGGGSYENVTFREDTAASNYNKNRTQLQYVAKSTGSSKTKLRIVAKKVGDTAEKNIDYKIKNKMNNQEYTIKVTVQEFKAKAYQVLYDNFGYDWYSSDGETKYGSSKNENVLIDNQDVLVGDVIALAANTGKFETSFKTTNLAKIKHISGKDTSGSNYTTMKKKSEAETPAGYSLDNDVSELKTVKFYTTDFPTSFQNNIYNSTNSITITDNGISTYYTTEAPVNVEAENSSTVKITFRENPSLWVISGQYQRQGCVTGQCASTGESNIMHAHLQSWGFTNTAYSHMATFSSKGTSLGGADLKSGLLKKGEIPYLNVSNWNDGASKADDVLAWTSGEKQFVTYKTINFKDPGTHPAAGFTEKMNGESTDYVYIVPSYTAPTSCYTLFTVSYKINKASGSSKWYYVNKNGEPVKVSDVEASTTEALAGGTATTRSDLRDCIFTYTSSSPGATTLHYPFVCSLDEKDYNEKTGNLNGQTTYTNNAEGVVKVGKYGKLTNQTNKNIYTTQGSANDLGCFRINAKALGWLDSDVTSVDIEITFISNKEFNRSYTFPIKFYNSTAPTTYEHD